MQEVNDKQASGNRTLRRLSALFCGTAMSSLAFGTALASAQTEPASANDPEDALIIDGVVVTATRRAQSADDIPISITAFDSQSIRDLGFVEQDDIAKQTSNLVFQSIWGDSSPNVLIRGIDNPGFAPNYQFPISVYSDDVLLGCSICQGFALYDLERIEVLKGPQGTLFGRNTTAGLIHFVSAKPTDEFEAFAEATYGNFDKVRLEGAVSGPLIPNRLNARLAGYLHKHDGFYDNYNDITGEIDAENVHGEEEEWGLRGFVEFFPSESTNILLEAQYNRNQGDAAPQFNSTSTTLFGQPSHFAACGLDCFSTGIDLEEDLELQKYSAQVNIETSLATITSVTGYVSASRFVAIDTDASVLNLLDEEDTEDAKQFSQEVRVTSNQDQRFDWIVGAYYYRDELDAFRFGNLTDLFGTAPDTTGTFTAYDQDTETYAVFGQGSYEVTDDVEVALGLRWTEDTRNSDQIFANPCYLVPDAIGGDFRDVENGIPFGGPSCTPFTLNPGERSWSNVSGRGEINYRPTDDALLYLSVSRGFKGGNYNLDVFNFPTEFAVAEPETNWAYEVGAKTSWLDNRLQANINFYYYDYRDLQVFALEPSPTGPTIINILTNADETEYSGLEAELRATPVDGLNLSLNVGVADGSFKDFIDAEGNDFSGNEPARKPDYTLSGAASYEIPLRNDRGWLTPQVSFSTVGPAFNNRNNVITTLDYTEVDARLTWNSADGGLRVSAWVENLLDDTTIVRTTAETIGTTFSQRNAPRTFGITLSVSM